MTKLEELLSTTAAVFNKIKLKLDSKLDKTAASVSAAKLTNPFTLSTTGDALSSVSIDGSGNVALALALKDLGITAGQYGSATVIPVVTVDSKGRVTAISTTSLGNAPTSSKLATARTISITGAGTASASFDGSANIALALTLADSGVVAGKFTKLTVDAKGRVTLGETLTAADIPDLAVGQITNLQSILDNKLGVLQNAASASKLATARTIGLTGDGTASVSFDGSQNVSGALTLANTGVTAGTYPKVTVNAKGLITGGAALVEADIPTLSIAKTSGLQSAIDAKLDKTANAVSASKLATARTLTFNGDVAGSGSFDGSADLSINLQIGDDNHNHSWLFTRDARAPKPSDLSITGTGAGRVSTLFGTAGGLNTGTADTDYQDLLLLDAWSDATGGLMNLLAFDKSEMKIAHYQAAKSATTWGTPRFLAYADQIGAGGSAKWNTPRTLSWTGDATGSMSVDGSQNVSAALTLANSGVTAGSYPKVTVNAKGLVTGGGALVAADIPNLDASKITSGAIPLANGGTGATSASAARTNLELDRFKQFSGSGQNGETQVINGAGSAYMYMNNVGWGLYDPVKAKTLFSINLSTGQMDSGIIPIACGGTNANTAAQARTNLGVKSMGTRDVFISTAAPTNSTGVDGDIWIQYV